MAEAKDQEQVETPAGTQAPSDGVEIARQELASLSPDDEAYSSTLCDVANELMSRFTLSGNPDDLDESISLDKQFLDLSPPGHPFHLAAISNLGGALIKRFKFRGDAGDLTEGVTCYEAALEACTPGQPYYLPLVGNLASGLLSRYRTYGDVKDLDRIVETNSTALSASPAASPHRDVVFNNLANAFKERFLKQGNRVDLDAALKHYQSCLELRPPGHRSRHSVLGNLADAMLIRFEADGRLADLDSAADYHVSALQQLSPGQDGYLFCLRSLGDVYRNYQGDTEKMKMAINCYQTAMEHSTVPNLDHSRLLDTYGATLRTCFILSGNMDDLDRAIQYLTTSSNIQPPTYSGRPVTLFSLGAALITRFNVTGNIADLDSSIENLASALQSCSPGFYQRHAMLSIYGRALSLRFSAKGDIEDLDLAVSASKEALILLSPQDLNYLSTVVNLTTTLLDHFRKFGNIEECQAIIDHCDRALLSTRPSDPAFIGLKINRAKAFFEKFRFERDEETIRTSIDAFRDIFPMLHEGHAEYVPVHLDFGMALETRFELSSDIKDIDEAIVHHRIARRHCEHDDKNYVRICMQLGNALRERFGFDGGSRDALDEAIVLLAEAEDILSPRPEQSDYKASLVNLGSALFTRFQAQGNEEDMDAVIEHMSRVVTLPAFHEEFLVLQNLATLLSARYSDSGDLEDLERSVQLFGAAAEQMPAKHVLRWNLCKNYGRMLVKLGRHRDPLQHLNAAVVLYKEALEYLPPSHIGQPTTNMYLAEALQERGRLLGNRDDLHSAIDILQSVMQILPKDNPEIYTVSHQAAGLSMIIYVELEDPSFMEDSFRYYEQAACYTQTRSLQSVRAALDWVAYAERLCHPSILLAYQTSLGSLNQHLLGTASVKGRRAALLNKHLVKQTGTLATDAAACAIAQGELGLAVELSEQGRGLLWSQLSRSRTPLDALRSTGGVGRALASDFERVSAQLAQSTITESPSVSRPSRLTMEETTRRYQQLSKELDGIISGIRQQQGFESFLDRSSFESLKCAAMGGPVILVNISRRRCDALIVLRDAPPRLIPLPNTMLEDMTALSEQLYRTLKTTKRLGDEKTRERQVVVVLRTLWDSIVRPIVDDLVTFLPRGARIWWCPTSKLTSLPLHAAGPYRKGGQNLPNLYISSYTPTLAALIRARQRPSPSSLSPTSFLAVGQATPAGSRSQELKTVSAELALVRSLVPTLMPFSELPDEASTADAVLSALRTHPWAHLACHGRPDVKQPFDAAFELRDRAVTVLDVVRARSVGTGVDEHRDEEGNGSSDSTSVTIPTPGEFAFLSACHTAAGDPNAPDEIVHLAAAMQFAGFRSVIGTMWAVDDQMATTMVRAFYKHMFSRGVDGGARGSKENGEPQQAAQWDYTQAARALNKATKSVDKDAVSIDQRIVFIHIGV